MEQPERSNRETLFINPSSIYYQVWEGFVAFSTLLSTLFSSFYVSFEENVWMFWINIALDVVFLFHIIIKFHVGFFYEGTLITEKYQIRRKYLHWSFWIDLFTIMPFDILHLRSTADNFWGTLTKLQNLRRILRFYTLTDFFGKYEDQLGLDTKSIRSSKYILIAFTLIHCLSCGWYVLACETEKHGQNIYCYQDGWSVVKKQNINSSSILQRYVKCLYWATITATSTGYGDIHAVNEREKWYSIFSMLLGIGFFFGPILGYMASNLTNSDSKRAKYTHRIEVIKHHLQDKMVSKETRQKVIDYYEHLWVHHKGIVKTGMFSELPSAFQAEISLLLNKHVLEKAPLFHDVGVEFLRMVSLVINTATFLPKQVIFSRNDIRSTLFYVKKGSVEVLSGEDDSTPVKVLQEGSFFGEISLLLNIPRCASVQAATYCELLMLERNDLMKILKYFPEVSEQLYAVMEQRCLKAIRKDEFIGCHTNKKTSSFPIVCSNDAGYSKLGFLKRFNSSICIIGKSHQKRWSGFVVLLNILMSFLHFYICCFKTSFRSCGYGENPFFITIFVLLYFLDGVNIYDAILECHPSKKDRRKWDCSLFTSLISSPDFWTAFISVIPLELFSLFFYTTYDRWIAATLLRSNRIFRFHKVVTFFENQESNIQGNIVHWRILKLMFYISFFSHVCACVMFMQACFGASCQSTSWAINAGFTSSSSSLELYITSLYWAVATMTSTGYGDIVANTTQGEFIVFFVLLIGLLTYGYCLSNIAATLTNRLSTKVEFMGRINAVITFMFEKHLAEELVGRVSRYLELIWRVDRGEAIPGSKVLMHDMPNRLQQEVCYEELQEIISKVPIFMNTDASFVKQLAVKLITYVFMPGDTVVYSGDVGREMYIIRRGLVEVLSKDKSNVVASLGPGGYFGEVGLIFGESRTADVRAKTYCELAMLRKTDLDQVLVEFPLIERQLHITSENRVVLAKIKAAAKKAGAPRRKSNRIDLIERSNRHRSKSIFGKYTSSVEALSKEECKIKQELNEEFIFPYKELNIVLVFLTKLLLRTTINPHGSFFRSWTALTVGLSCIHLFTLALQMSFLQDAYGLWIVNHILDMVFLVDMYLKLHVSFYNKEGVLVTHPLATAQNYLKTNFIVDFLACAPIDIFMLFSSDTRAYNLAKVNRCFHIIKMSLYFDYLEEPMGKSIGIFRNLKFGVYMCLLTHIFACGWYMCACPGRESNNLIQRSNHSHTKSLLTSHFNDSYTSKCLERSWAVENGRNLVQETVLHQYITSIYWAAATTCSVGYGDIHAYSTIEMVYAVVSMVIGVVFYGYVVASTAASLANADAQRARYQQKLDTINCFLKEQNVCSLLKKRILGFYEFLWIRNKGVDLENLFQGLPISLQADITLSLYKDIIESVPLFQGTEIGFTKMVSLYIKPLLVPKGEYIVRKGDIGEEMFFINKGVVEVVSEHENPIIFDTMTPGRFFGEISTIFKCPRTASIRTQTNADLYVLKKKDLDVVLGHYPHIKKQIIETAEERQRLVQERAKAAAKKKNEDHSKKSSEHVKLQDSLSNAEDVYPLSKAKYHSILDNMKTVFKRVKFKVHDDLLVERDGYFKYFLNWNCCLNFISYLLILYMASFQSYPSFAIALTIFTDICFYIEMYLRFHLVSISDSGDKVSNLNEIARSYWNGEFKFDCLANFPFKILAYIVSTNEAKLKYFSYFNLTHILRLRNLFLWFSQWLKKLNTNVLMIRLGENLIQIIVTLQFFACMWFVLACPASYCKQNSWASHRKKNVFTPVENYVDTLYWALATMTSTGYGDIHATNDIEKVFASVVMISGKLIFGFVLGNVASTMANMEMLRVKFEERFSAVQSHMKDQDMPLKLQERVVNFFQYMWRRNRGSKSIDIFSDLPPCLHADLCLEVTGRYLQNVSYFSDCELAFIRQISKKMQLVQFHKGEFITRKGDIGNEMYLLKKGEIEICQSGVKEKVLFEGDFFGEEALIFNRPRKFTTSAKTHADVFCLNNRDLEVGFSLYPQEKVKVNEKLENGCA